MRADVERARRAATLLQLPGTLEHIAPHGNGRIHDTYVLGCRVDGAPRRVLLQRMNQAVFRDVPGMMSNLVRVTEHLQAQLRAAGVADAARRALQLIPACDGAPYVRSDEGELYRAFVFIEHASSLSTAQTPAQAWQAGRAFGELQLRLADLPAPPLLETIPGFHDTLARLRALDEAAAVDALGRATAARRELQALRARTPLAQELARALAAHELPLRIAHNDAKTDNVLFDVHTQEALCVVDLDTVMPGLWLHDYGDLTRSVACGTAEDAAAQSTLQADIPKLVALTTGYVEQVGPLLCAGEWTHLPSAPQLIALELASRFLTDHLAGDHYFKVEHADQNLARARLQLGVLEALEASEAPLRALLLRLRDDSAG